MADETPKAPLRLPAPTPEQEQEYRERCDEADKLMERAILYMLDEQQLPSSAVFNALVISTVSVARTLIVVVKPEYAASLLADILQAIDSLRAEIVNAAGGADIDRESYLAHRRGMRVPDRPQ